MYLRGFHLWHRNFQATMLYFFADWMSRGISYALRQSSISGKFDVISVEQLYVWYVTISL